MIICNFCIISGDNFLRIYKYEAEAVDLFVAQYGENPCTAHEIYFGISEILYMLACEGEEGSRITRMEETIARALSVNWTEYDVPGAYRW